jgi:hypothetical protein
MQTRDFFVLSALASVLSWGCNNSDFQASAERKPRSADQSKGKGTDTGDGEDDDDDRLANPTTGDEDDTESGGSDSDNSTGSDGDQDNDGDVEGSDSESGADDAGVEIDESSISDACDAPKGNDTSSSILGGEDVPGNGLLGGPDKGKPFGSDFDDFFLTLSGSHLVEKDALGAYAKIGFRESSKIKVSYRRGTTDCSHQFRFLIRKCPNKDSTVKKTYTLNPGRGDSAEVTFDISGKNLFLDIEIVASASSTKQFGGCTLPIPITSLLYGGGVPVLIQ